MESIKTYAGFYGVHKNLCYGCSLESPQRGYSNEHPQHRFLWRIDQSDLSIIIKYYRVIALISADIVPSLDIEGCELASICRYPNEGQYSPISVQ